jgi:hypothetical protein
MKKNSIVAIVAAFCGSFVYAGASSGPLSLGVYEETSFNDNVFLAPKGMAKDWTVLSRTGLSLGYIRDRSDLSLGASGQIGNSHDWRFSGRDYLDYNLGSTAKYDHGRWQLTLGANFSDNLTLVDSTNTQQTETYTNALNALWNYDWNTVWGLAIDGSWQQRTYVGMPEFDNNTYTVGLAPYYRLSSRTRVGVRAGYDWTLYNQNTQQVNSASKFLNAFVTYELTTKLNFRLEGGYMSRQSDDGPDGTAGQSWQGMNARASLRYQPNRRWEFEATLGMQPTDSYAQTVKAQGKTMVVTNASLGATWSVTDKLSVSQRITYAVNDDKTSYLDNQQYGYNLDVGYKLGRHLGVSVGYAYSAIDYSNVPVASDSEQNIVKCSLTWTF